MQEIVDAVRDEIPAVSWRSAFSDGRRNVRTWMGQAPGYSFIVSEYRDAIGAICSGTVGIAKNRVALKLPPKLAEAAVRAAKGGA
jgi:hypothetical protein